MMETYFIKLVHIFASPVKIFRIHVCYHCSHFTRSILLIITIDFLILPL